MVDASSRGLVYIIWDVLDYVCFAHRFIWDKIDCMLTPFILCLQGGYLSKYLCLWPNNSTVFTLVQLIPLPILKWQPNKLARALAWLYCAKVKHSSLLSQHFGVPSEKQASKHWLWSIERDNSLTVQLILAGPEVTTSVIIVVA